MISFVFIVSIRKFLIFFEGTAGTMETCFFFPGNASGSGLHSVFNPACPREAFPWLFVLFSPCLMFCFQPVQPADMALNQKPEALLRHHIGIGSCIVPEHLERTITMKSSPKTSGKN